MRLGGRSYEKDNCYQISVSCAALGTSLLIPAFATADNPAAIAVRSTGEVDVVAQGPDNTPLLRRYSRF